jgi:lysophospholipase L1-like esterase
MRARPAWLAVAACCLAVIGAAWLVLALAAPSGPSARTAASTATAGAEATRPTMVVVGASYSAALGATSPRRGYAELLGAELGWRVAVSAVPGSGYLNPGPLHQGTFLQRLRRVHGVSDPRLVLIQGGRNDADYPAARLGAAVCTTVAGARARFAGASVVLLGNVPFRLPVPRDQRRVASTLSHAAARCRAPFLNPIREHWITADNERRFLGPVPDHPNDAGYHYIARRLAADLHRLRVVGDPDA